VESRRIALKLDGCLEQLEEARFRMWLATTCYEAAVLLMIENCGRLTPRLP
jgi:hypothetical protein